MLVLSVTADASPQLRPDSSPSSQPPVWFNPSLLKLRTQKPGQGKDSSPGSRALSETGVPISMSGGWALTGGSQDLHGGSHGSAKARFE